MTQDEIIRMAKECGVHEYGPLTRNWSFELSQFERFAALVRAEALAEPVKQEPVATVMRSEDDSLIFTPLYDFYVVNDMGLYAAPVSAKREWVDLEPWQLCEIEERIGLPIDSHDFETIGNAYISAFKEKNK